MFLQLYGNGPAVALLGITSGFSNEAAESLKTKTAFCCSAICLLVLYGNPIACCMLYEFLFKHGPEFLVSL